MKFDPQRIIDEHGGKCKTRDGRDAVIYAVVGSRFPVIGAIFNDDDGHTAAQWGLEGNVFDYAACCDLIMPRTLVAEWWCNAYHKSYATGLGGVQHPALEEAQHCVGNASATTIHTRLYSDNTVESEVVE